MGNKENLLQIGSVVKLKSKESPSMVINKELSDEIVECVWFNGNISKKEIFNKKVLYDYESLESANKMTKEDLKNLTMEQLEKLYYEEQKELGIKK